MLLELFVLLEALPALDALFALLELDALFALFALEEFDAFEVLFFAIFNSLLFKIYLFSMSCSNIVMIV